MADWKTKAKERIKEKQEGATHKLAEGDNCFRVMPNAKGTKYPPYIEIRIHRDVGPDKRLVRCGKNIDGEGKCWMCDVVVPGLHKKKKTQMAESLASHDQMIVQVSPVNPETNKFGKPKPWWVSTGGPRSLSFGLLSLLASPKRSYDDPKKGYNINVTRTGTTMNNTRYGAMQPDEAPSTVPPEIVKLVQPFDEAVPQYSMEEQKKIYYGERQREEEPEEPEDEDTEEEVEGEDSDEEEEESTEDDDEDSGDEEESEESDDDNESEDDEEEADDESDEDDEEEAEESDDEVEEEDEEEEPKPTKAVKKSAPSAKKPTKVPIKKPVKKTGKK